jgi:hypothetical protein
MNGLFMYIHFIDLISSDCFFLFFLFVRSVPQLFPKNQPSHFLSSPQLTHTGARPARFFGRNRPADCIVVAYEGQ